MNYKAWQLGLAGCLALVTGCGGDDAASNSPPAAGEGPGSGAAMNAGSSGGGGGVTMGAGNAAPAASAQVPIDDGAGEAIIFDDGSNDPPGETGIRPGDAVDLLLVIDNSTSMGDKQAVFRQAVPDLVDQMVNPPCFDTVTQQFVPFAEDGTCNGISESVLQIFPPVEDIHIALISSSLGSHGLGPDQHPDSPICDDNAFHQNDRAYLIPQVRPEAALPTDDPQGFLVWDSSEVADEQVRLSNKEALVQAFQAHVDAVDEIGCGFEAPLEAAYRFLIEPEPYEQLVRGPCSDADTSNACVHPEGLDQALLDQRNAFLRPDSAVVVVFLTDENDCSVQDRRQGYFTLLPAVMAGSTSVCDSNPNDDCCHSCASSVPAGCPDQASNGCTERAREALESASDSALSEAFNLRCFNQKQRFGVNLLYDTERYAAGFQRSMVAARDNTGVPNPLFAAGRTPDRVFMVGIVGVPWQDTAVDAGSENLELQRTAALDWSLFLPGEDGSPPGDPFNVETMSMRSGTHPITQEVLGGPDTSNSINGHDRLLAPGDHILDDIQYACIFPLAEPRDCTAENEDESTCDCTQLPDPSTEEIIDYAADNPLCMDPDTGEYGTTQYFAKAYPAPRILRVLRDMGEQGVLSSICPRNALDPSVQDFGYRPAIRALLLNLSPIDTAK